MVLKSRDVVVMRWENFRPLISEVDCGSWAPTSVLANLSRPTFLAQALSKKIRVSWYLDEKRISALTGVLITFKVSMPFCPWRWR